MLIAVHHCAQQAAASDKRGKGGTGTFKAEQKGGEQGAKLPFLLAADEEPTYESLLLLLQQ